MTVEPAIHLSVVATSRNDNHGGSLTFRTQHFIDGLVEQCKRHRIRAELILVEWNPPGDRVSLAEEMKWPSDPGLCDIRIVTVPREVHARLAHADKLPLFQMIAKNVGIRRARGKYVLATNIDILFSDQVFARMATNLPGGRLYRNDRCDVPSDVPTEVPFERILEFCEKGMFRINANGMTVIRTGEAWKWFDLLLVRLEPRIRNLWLIGPPAARVFLHRLVMAFWRTLVRVLRMPYQLIRFVIRAIWRGVRLVGRILGPAWGRLARIAGLGIRGMALCLRFVIGTTIDRESIVNELRQALIRRLYPMLGETIGTASALPRRPSLANLFRALVFLARRRLVRLKNTAGAVARNALTHCARKFDDGLRALKYRLVVAPVAWVKGLVASNAQMWKLLHRYYVEKPLFTNGCGDFTLLSRDDWFRLRGYPEWEIFSWNIDSVLLAQARRMNIRETYLGWHARCFHIEHGKGSGYTPEGADALFERLNARQIPYLSFAEYLELVAEMDALAARDQPIYYNGENWGFSQDNLPDVQVAAATVHTGRRAESVERLEVGAARV